MRFTKLLFAVGFMASLSGCMELIESSYPPLPTLAPSPCIGWAATLPRCKTTKKEKQKEKNELRAKVDEEMQAGCVTAHDIARLASVQMTQTPVEIQLYRWSDALDTVDNDQNGITQLDVYETGDVVKQENCVLIEQRVVKRSDTREFDKIKKQRSRPGPQTDLLGNVKDTAHPTDNDATSSTYANLYDEMENTDAVSTSGAIAVATTEEEVVEEETTTVETATTTATGW